MKKKGMGKRAFAACLAIMTVAQSNAFAATGIAGGLSCSREPGSRKDRTGNTGELTA